jgi:hypothetical protein
MAELNSTAELTVPMVVLDRFLKLSQENHEAYAAMVTAVDSMSSKMLELTDQMLNMQGKLIEKDELYAVIQQALKTMKDDLAVVKAVRDEVGALKVKYDSFPDLLKDISVCAGNPEYNVLHSLAENLKFGQKDKKDVQALALALEGLLKTVAFFQQRKLVFAFCAGTVIITMLGSAGEGAKAVIKLILSLLG